MLCVKGKSVRTVLNWGKWTGCCTKVPMSLTFWENRRYGVVGESGGPHGGLTEYSGHLRCYTAYTDKTITDVSKDLNVLIFRVKQFYAEDDGNNILWMFGNYLQVDTA